MTDPIVLEEGKIYKVKPPIMSQSALYQLSRYAYENDLRFMQGLMLAIFDLDVSDPYAMENSELERRIKDFLCKEKK